MNMDYMDDEDPIIGEVRRARGAIADLCGNDARRIAEYCNHGAEERLAATIRKARESGARLATDDPEDPPVPLISHDDDVNR
jgi:hypothetical protein